MTIETDKDYSDRRAIEEQALADKAADAVQSIPHSQLSALHTEVAKTADAVQQTPLDVAAVAGSVTLSSPRVSSRPFLPLLPLKHQIACWLAHAIPLRMSTGRQPPGTRDPLCRTTRILKEKNP